MILKSVSNVDILGMFKDKFYITTAIDYINAKPHIGHAYEKVASDVLARYFASKIGRDKVWFLTGTDEHGAKIAQAAEASGTPIEEFAKQTAATFSFAWDQLNLQYDRFIRTTDSDHINKVEEILVKIKEKGYVYEADYEGLYCVGHEAFITERDLVNGLCPEHKTTPEKIKEKNWFLKTSEFTKTIQEKIEKDELEIWPAERKNEVLGLLEQGFNDTAISRPNVKWGIPLPWDKEQTVYVWVDALINYLTGAKDGKKDWWPADVHIIGKDIIKFHCIIWPAILLAAGLDLPKKIVVHGYLTVGGEKISKSLGNVIDPNDWVAKYGSDAVRYLLLREVAFGQDGDVSEEKLKARYEGELANGLGNLVSRITTLVENNLGGEIKIEKIDPNNPESEEIHKLIENFEFHAALAKIWQWVIWANKTTDEKKLWELAKTDLDEFKKIAGQILGAIEIIAKELSPFIPETSKKILDHLAKEKITKAEPLFPKIS